MKNTSAIGLLICISCTNRNITDLEDTASEYTTSEDASKNTTSEDTGIPTTSDLEDINPICGNNKRESGEECDSGNTGGDFCTVDCKKKLIIFVTSESFNGSFEPVNDLLSINVFENCNYYAGMAGLYGRFKPWISTNAVSALDFLNHSDNEYVLIDGTLVANNWDDLTDGTLQHPINLDENGDLREVDVWTGTLANGDGSEFYCDDWTDDWIDTLGTWGHSRFKDSNWTHYVEIMGEEGLNPTTCSSWSSLYCVEYLLE